MSRHMPRKDRWASFGPNEHRSETGRVYYQKGQWHAALRYRVSDPELLTPGELQTWEASRFKRPRNAMIALEDKVTELQRRHGAHISFLKPE
jgi:hypothetical protein